MSVKSTLVVAASVAVIVGVAGCADSGDTRSQPDLPASSEPSAAGPGDAENTAPSQGASAPSEDGEDRSAAEPVVIEIKDFEYHGPDKVAPGATIMVQNNDRSTHSLTSEGDDFTEVVLEGGGASGMFTAPRKTGEYAYVCKFHPEMVDTLVVG
jgi:plastocyanin